MARRISLAGPHFCSIFAPQWLLWVRKSSLPQPAPSGWVALMPNSPDLWAKAEWFELPASKIPFLRDGD
jgi:hypothetical protein